ncbi:MAG: iron ABC transporter permease [Chromatiales bacterium]|nr:iron ABC transporter permease [Gammaproteobacteria bacterium]MBW6475737.1 iron ABC transporter permease [Chromatiales bacterium]
MRGPLILLLLLLLSLIAIATALMLGSVAISLDEIWAVLRGQGSALNTPILLELRLPRALAAFAVGGMLALAGAQMQVLLGNPLADPFILGISGGAAVGALLAMLAGAVSFGVNGAALLGAMTSMLLVFVLAHGRGSWSPTRLLLTGVVVAAGWGAVISFLLVLAPQHNLPGMLFWLMGDLSHARHVSTGLFILALGLLLALPQARSLNLLARGELQAAALGVAVKPLRLQLYLTTSLLTATAVTLAGSIGFVGLIIPHLLRLIIGSDHRLLLPASVLAGGSLLVIADTLARSLFAPQQLPVGVLTALIGVPVFLYLLQRGHTR